MEVYKYKKNIGFTEEQAVALADIATKRAKSKTFLIREYVDRGTAEDLISWEAAQAPSEGE